MQNTTPVAAELPNLPVCLTPQAWREAVHIDTPCNPGVICDRLSDVIREAYREFQLQPGVTPIHFGLYRVLPAGTSTDRVWLDLKIDHIESPPGKFYLYISLKEETQTACP